MSYIDHDKISAIRYQQPELSPIGLRLEPERTFTPIINSKNILYKTLFEPFDKEYCLNPRLPIDMGCWKELLDLDVPNVLRLPLKNKAMPYHLPQEMGQLKDLLEFVANYEQGINPRYGETFCHITVDRSAVEQDSFHRFPGWHTDGYQGAKLTPKLLPEHSYIFVSEPGTEACLQPFFLQHLDDSKHNAFLEMDRQARADNVYRLLPNHLYLIDPYIVHRTPRMEKAVERLFIRITFVFAELDHPKNTVNPMLAPYQYLDRIDIRQNLKPVEFDVPYPLYGLSKGVL